MSDERKEPIWKKEISFGRKPDGRDSGIDTQHKSDVDAELEEIKAAAIAAVTPDPPRPEPARRPTKPLPQEPEEPVVLEPEPEVVAEEAVWVEPEVESVPFWKRDIGKSKSKAPKAAKEPKAKKEPRAKKEPAARDTEAKPFWKKELSLSRSSAPKEPKAKKEKSAKAAKPEGDASTPFWKRELSLGKGKSAAADGGSATDAKTVKRAKGSKAPKQQKAPTQGKGGLVGLKIGASQIAAARVMNANGSPQLLQVARIELPDGVVVGGELRDVEGLTTALKELFAKHKLPKRGVRLGIANNRIGVRTFEITGIDDSRQLANAIRFRAQETLPIPLEEAVLDWQVLSERVDPESGQAIRRVLLVVAYRELVDRYVLACRQAGIRLAGIDLEAFAMLRALSAPPAADAPEPTGAQVVVNVGHDRSTFAVSDGRVCEFTRVLSWGGQSLSVAIARALDMTPSEATPIKHALSLVATYAPPEGVSVEAMNTARDAVNRELQSFARELVSSLRFYQNQPGSLGIGELVLTGGTAHLPGFADELNRLIGVRVRVGDPLNRIAIAKKFQEPDDYGLGSLTVAIGLGIDD